MGLVAGLTYFSAFVVGPVLFALLMRLQPRRGSFAILVLLIAGLMAASYALSHVPGLAPRSMPPQLAALAMLWLAWVIALAFTAMALRRRLLPEAGRWVLVAGILATTLPWFGLATATFVGF